MVNDILLSNSKKIEARFEQLLPTTKEQFSDVVEAMRYSFLNGGKRIRPTLMLEFMSLCGAQSDLALNFAVALEMIHCYSLIHDDLPCMDNDDFRRGKPSCHKAFGEDTALLAGDALLTYAFECASKSEGVDDISIIKAITVLAKNAGFSGMIGGQVVDLAIENTSADIETVKKMYLMKTGELLCAACEIGCILANADDEKITAARNYALDLGLAFQIIDDILDNIGDEKVLGKPIGSDQKNNKTTFVSKYGIEHCREIADELTQSAKKSLDVFGGDKTRIYAITDYLLNRNY